MMKQYLAIVLFTLAVAPCQSYIRSTNAAGIPLRRIDSAGIPILLNPSVAPGATNSAGAIVIPSTSDPANAINLAAAEWSQVPSASVSFLGVQPTTLSNDPRDGKFVLTMVDTPTNRSIVGDFLAITLTQYNIHAQITDSDIIYNPDVGGGAMPTQFSTDHLPGTYDFQSLTAHEIGHTLGATHSSVIGATMFQSQVPFAFFVTPAETTAHTILSADDLAFLSDTYPAASAISAYGSISGRVTFSDGKPVLGALVDAVDPSIGVVIGGISSLVDGFYHLSRVPPGNYTLYAHPANGPVQPRNISLPLIGAENTSFRVTFGSATVEAGPQTAASLGHDLVVDPAPDNLQIAFIGTGQASGTDYDYTSGGVKSVVAGSSSDLLLWGPGLDGSITESMIKLYGKGLTLRAGSLHLQPSAVVSGYVPLRFTVDVPPATSTTDVTIAIQKDTDGAVYSGGLIFFPQSTGSTCGYWMQPKKLAFNAAGGQQDLNMTAGANCAWSVSDAPSWLTISGGSGAGNGTITFQAAGNLTPNPRSAAIQIAEQTITVTQEGTASSLLQGVADAAGYSSFITADAFVALSGTNISSQTLVWDEAAASGTLPVSLGGVSVSMNGIPAYVQYVSPTQVNVLTPPQLLPGNVDVLLTTPNGSAAMTVQAGPAVPGFFAYSAGGRLYPVATFANSSTWVGNAGVLQGVTSQPAKPGDYVVLYVNGLGGVVGAVPLGQVLTAPFPLAATPAVTINGVTAPVLFAGMTYAGLYQVNIQIPASAGAGDVPIVLRVGNAYTQSGTYLTLQP